MSRAIPKAATASRANVERLRARERLRRPATGGRSADRAVTRTGVPPHDHRHDDPPGRPQGSDPLGAARASRRPDTGEANAQLIRKAVDRLIAPRPHLRVGRPTGGVNGGCRGVVAVGARHRRRSRVGAAAGDTLETLYVGTIDQAGKDAQSRQFLQTFLLPWLLCRMSSDVPDQHKDP